VSINGHQEKMNDQEYALNVKVHIGTSRKQDMAKRLAGIKNEDPDCDPILLTDDIQVLA
jgi:hypothetical protein